MEKDFIVNIIHRIELSPEYSQKATQQGQKENIADTALTSESVEIFKTQQRLAHENGLKTTIQMTYASLFSDDCVALAKADHERYGDEIALSLLGLPCEEFRKKYHTKDFCIWMFSEEDKRAIVDDVFGLFKKKFGFYPQSTGSYYLDAYTINYIKANYPSVIAAVATCWEEGPKAFHTTNNSWYTFLDGGEWAPWIPSKENTHCPALNKEDDSGIVAIPHLSRDLIACFDGNGSNFGTHPQNILRGMVYEGQEWPYLYNLIDQYRHEAKYNAFAYNMMFVGPGWMNKAGRWECSYETLVKSYSDAMSYYGKLKKDGQLKDMTMSEFALYYRAHKSYLEPEVSLWKDIVYGSNKEHFWYVDPFLRTCLDMNQGGAMIDLRPYAAQLDWKVGIGTRSVYDASYPYLIQANYRAGYFTHYAGEGTVKSLKVSYQGEVVDTCLCRSMASVTRQGEDVLLTLDPITIDFRQLKLVIGSSFLFKRGTGEIVITRRVLNDLQGAKVDFEEYLSGAFGTTEYQADMSKIRLGVKGKSLQKSLRFAYKNRHLELKEGTLAYAEIPEVNTLLEMTSPTPIDVYVDEGYAFSPCYRLALKKTLTTKGELITCLKVKKAA
jgi:hypothetical protein